MDSQTSADTVENGLAVGAMSYVRAGFLFFLRCGAAVDGVRSLFLSLCRRSSRS